MLLCKNWIKPQQSSLLIQYLIQESPAGLISFWHQVNEIQIHLRWRKIRIFWMLPNTPTHNFSKNNSITEVLIKCFKIKDFFFLRKKKKETRPLNLTDTFNILFFKQNFGVFLVLSKEQVSHHNTCETKS